MYQGLVAVSDRTGTEQIEQDDESCHIEAQAYSCAGCTSVVPFTVATNIYKRL